MNTLATVQKETEIVHAEPALADWDGFVAAETSVPSWVQILRARGHDRFAGQGLPNAKWERWKYTNLPAAIKRLDVSFSEADISFKGDSAYVKSISEGFEAVKDVLELSPAGHEQYEDMSLWGLSNAYLRDGVLVDIPKDVHLDSPIEISVTGKNGQFIAPRFVYRVADGAEATIIENLDGEDAYWSHNLIQIIVGKGAKLHHYRVQGNSAQSVLTQQAHIQVEEGGHYEAFVLTTGAALSRNQSHAEILGSDAVCSFYGVNMLKNAQLGDTTITIEHAAPNCNSNQAYKTVLDDQARGVFQGKVHVHQIAQKTDGYQLSNALLLSEGAEMDTKPELEIYADDVKCSHGATTGKLDDEPLFYMRARGIPEEQARNLLIQSYVGEVVDYLEEGDFKSLIQDKIAGWLEHA
jgi:Fe-S cluster assembly protein SufD